MTFRKLTFLTSQDRKKSEEKTKFEKQGKKYLRKYGIHIIKNTVGRLGQITIDLTPVPKYTSQKAQQNLFKNWMMF